MGMKQLMPVFFAVIYFAILISCGGKNTSSNVTAPGNEKSAKDKTLSTGAHLLQDKTPLATFSVYLDGFHFYNGNLNAQMEAHHYVAQLNEDVYQAVIFDGNGKNAKLMGVEYIITDTLFKTLPEEEKTLWHSHHFEVKSGTLIAPALPDVAEHELMEKLVSTYGKTIHTWHTDQQRTLPVGAPAIMMGFTKEGQLHPDFVTARDERFNNSTKENKQKRADIPMPSVDAGANAWEKGDVKQLVISTGNDSAAHKHPGVFQIKQ